MVRSIMNDKQIKEFDATKECNFAIAPQGIGRFPCQRVCSAGHVGAVLRTITTEIPTLEDLESATDSERRRHEQARSGDRRWRYWLR